MMEKLIRAKYQTKSKDSFKTKKNLFLFSLALSGIKTFNSSNFHNFKITDDLVKKYSGEYWQELESYEIYGLSIKEISTGIEKLEKENIELIKKLEKEYIDSFSKIFSEGEFIQLLEKRECHYCGITLDGIESLIEKRKLYKKSLRGWSLEIDRLNSNIEYTPDNCVMSCYWCNNAKTDEFTPAEFLKVGKVIKEIWQERLK
jgi:5-methylcytosine-specific restriction endonuclease McrA